MHSPEAARPLTNLKQFAEAAIADLPPVRPEPIEADVLAYVSPPAAMADRPHIGEAFRRVGEPTPRIPSSDALHKAVRRVMSARGRL